MALHMSEEEYAAFLRRTRTTVKRTAPVPPREDQKRKSKYGNQRVEVDGMKFDSKHEAAVYQQLLMRVKAGELRAVIRQVKFDLPGGIAYIADFVAIRPDFFIEGVYDAKSAATKQMQALYGIEILEV